MFIPVVKWVFIAASHAPPFSLDFVSCLRKIDQLAHDEKSSLKRDLTVNVCLTGKVSCKTVRCVTGL